MADAEIATRSCGPGETRALARLRSATGSRSSIPRSAGRLGAVDVRVSLEVWPHVIREWPLFCRQIGAGLHAAAVGGFIRSILG